MKKKKKFIRFFLWRFAVCALAMLAAAGYYTVYQEYITAEEWFSLPWEDRDKSREEEAVIMIEKDGDIRKALSYITTNNYGFTSDPCYECGVMLYRPETGEAYISKPLAIAHVIVNGKKKLFYNEDEALIDRLNSMALLSNVLIYDIYTEGDTFVPGRVFQRKLRFSIRDPLGEQTEGPFPGEWVDLTPANTEGWTHITSS